MGWLAFAPLVVLLFLVGALRAGRSDAKTTLREDVLGAALLLGVSIALGTEVLSAFRLVSGAGILGFWLTAIAVAAGALVWRWRRGGAPAPVRLPALDTVDGLMLGGIATVALTTLVVAWLAPPQSSDALSYHMGRVMHWIQNGSIAPYPTYDSRQLYHPPFAEIVQLHLYLLAGSDRAACLLQWFAAVGTLLAVSVVARDLGGNRRVQIFAVLFAATLPIGVTQATSGKNGWLEALWLLSFTCFSGAAATGGLRVRTPVRVVAAFAALGLGMTTKLTAWFFAAPFVVVAVVRAFRTPGVPWRFLLLPSAIGVFLVCALTFPFLARNFAIYGNPVVDPVARARSGLEYLTPAVVASNALRNVFFQLGTDSPAINEAMMAWVVGVHRWIGADPFDARTSQGVPFRVSPPTRMEEKAFSPLHLALVFAVGLAMIASRHLRADGARLPYLAALGAGYLLFCATVTWQAPNCRLLMPLLLLAAPLAAVVIADVLGGRLVPAIGAVLFVACLPYATGTESRPLSLESGKGVLVTPRRDLYYVRVPWLRKTHEEVARVVRESHTRDLGLVMTNPGNIEYLLWVLLKDAHFPVRIEHMNVTDASGRLASQPPWRDFRPQLVVALSSGSGTKRFARELVVAGTKFTLARSFGAAGFYEPVGDGRPGASESK